jgi:hypothetical protein
MGTIMSDAKEVTKEALKALSPQQKLGLGFGGLVLFLFLVFSGVISRFFQEIGFGFQTLSIFKGTILLFAVLFLIYKATQK